MYRDCPFAFHDEAQVYRAIDGDLGAYLAKEMAAKGIYAVPRGCFENGFRQITCSLRPIRKVEDLSGVKMRTPDTPYLRRLLARARRHSRGGQFQ